MAKNLKTNVKAVKGFIKGILPEKAVKRYYRFRKKQRNYFKKSRLFQLFLPESTSVRFARYYKRYDVKDDLILYESYGGFGMVCNPLAMFKVLITDPQYAHFKHVWAIENDEERRLLQKKYKKYKNVSFSSRSCKKYTKALVTAKYLINNSGFPGYFSKKKEQIYVDTWHSITVKTLGFDSPKGKITDANVLRNMLMADYILCANSFMTDIFKKSYKLDGFYQGLLIEEGYPRNDLLINADKEAVFTELGKRGIEIDRNKKVILYAPTWKGVSFINTGAEAADYETFTKNILRNIDSNKYQVLIKPHYGVYRNLSYEDKKSGKYIHPTIDTNEILSIVDILISDYSSIALDFLHTDKPILYYIPDLQNYNSYRGVYFQPDELPGPASEDQRDIWGWINSIDEVVNEYRDKYLEFKSWVCEHDDGKSAERIVDCVFNNHEKYRVYDISKTNKKRILLYGSVLLTNGVTSTLLDRLNRIDYDKYDVSLIVFNRPKKEGNNKNILKVNENVRVLCRVGTFAATNSEKKAWQQAHRNGIDLKSKRETYPKALIKRDFERSYGMSKFDYAIDYSGYSLYYPLLLSQAEGAKKIIWQHNDLHRDINNESKMKQKSYKLHKMNVLGAVSAYGLFDKIVSVGKSAMIENRKHFSTEETWDRFTYVNNLVDSEPIVKKSEDYLTFEKDGIKYYCDDRSFDRSTTSRYSLRVVPFPEHNNINFINMGRLSSEKNQVNLLEAFNKVHKTYPNSRLYIIGGGDLEGKLKKIIKSYDLLGKVVLTGRLSNPFGLMKNCDCFILPSLYEGLCTAVLEARILGMPIILSDFSTAKDVSMENGQIMVDNSVEGIYRGMMHFIEDKKEIDYNFDANLFNKMAMKQFEALFD